MTRLPTLYGRKIIQALEQAGFVFFKQRGSHCILRHPITRQTTCVPVHGQDVKRSLMKEILQQAGLTEEEFRKLKLITVNGSKNRSKLLKSDTFSDTTFGI